MELNIESLTKHYGTNCALKEFTVCLHPGVYGLLGPNGAGKSTLMNLLTDTIKRESGNILYDGKKSWPWAGITGPWWAICPNSRVIMRSSPWAAFCTTWPP